MKDSRYVLGLDLGVTSIGWAIIELRGPGSKPTPNSVHSAGVRIFEAGVEGDVKQGRDSSRGAVRREARLPRRQHWRRQFRKKKLFRVLQQFDLLPSSDDQDSRTRKRVLDQLDEQLGTTYFSETTGLDENAARKRHQDHQLLPYLIRAKGIEEPLTQHELGRALYHLAQRRGYKSNRKADKKDDADGIVAQSIDSITEAAQESTLGQFFASQVDLFSNKTDDEGNPDPTTGRIRRRYTSRGMYQNEFEQLKSAQRDHHNLTDAQWNKIEQVIFFQRPLKSQKRLIGKCSLERDQKRCAEALPIFQEFRVLQTVNNLRVRDPNGIERPLDESQRERLIDHLNTVASVSLKSAAIKKKLEIPSKHVFTIEDWDSKIVGHRTNQQLLKVFGDRWWELTAETQHDIASDVLYYRNLQALRRRAREVWGLDAEQAELLGTVTLEEGHGSLSRRAMEKLLPLMRDGLSFAEARKQVYPDSFTTDEIFDSLPPVTGWAQELRNPAVTRVLSQLRKVVNSLIDRYGKPEIIRVELARNLKNSRDRRRKIWDNQKDNERRRKKAEKELLDKLGFGNPNRSDIERWMLGQECNRQCPYCGHPFLGSEIIGTSGTVNIEHIFPRRYLDNSFSNKTLACRGCNDRKGDLLPSEAFSANEMEKIIERVKAFIGPHRVRKLQRMQATEVPEGFTSRDLNDTRYLSRLSADYLGLLYGGRVDADSRQRVSTPTGGLTALMRRGWGLNAVLSKNNDRKSRDDHRHHAVDAVVVALSSQDHVQKLSKAAASSDKFRQRDTAFLSNFDVPWPEFVSEVRDAVDQIVVSHRPTRTMGGAMHAESIYSEPHDNHGKQEFRVRKELKKLTEKEITGDQIVDPGVREAVQTKWAQIKQENPKAKPSQVWSDPRTNEDQFPRLRNRATKLFDGTPIFKVRLRMTVKPRKVGKGARSRNVASGKDTNFACMVYATINAKGEPGKWTHEVIDRMTAYERLSTNPKEMEERILIPDLHNGKREFKFAIRKNDTLELDDADGERQLYRVVSFSGSEIQIAKLHVPHLDKDQRTKWNRVTSTTSLRDRNVEVVQITPDGRVERGK